MTQEPPDEDDVKGEIQQAVLGDFTARGRDIPFGYVGGKYKHLPFILPLLPVNKAYIEPYCGSAVVLLNRPESDVETINDVDGRVVNFFRVLRESPQELVYQLATTPHSEDEHALDPSEGDGISDIEAARRFFTRVNMSYNTIPEGGSWAYSKSYSSRGVPKPVSAYRAKLRRLKDIAARLSGVQITNREAIDVIETFSTDDATIYADPPYPEHLRGRDGIYSNEMDRSSHRDMGGVLDGLDADVAVSSYASDLYDDIFLERGWTRIDSEPTTSSATGGAGDDSEIVESLYVNYDVGGDALSESDAAGVTHPDKRT